jgi:Tfp pilus assembly protein PilW
MCHLEQLRDRNGSDERGIGLVDLLIAMMILSIVVVIFGNALIAVQRGAQSEDYRSQNNDQARLAIEQLDREIRSANYTYDPSTETSRTLGSGLTNGYALRIYGQANAATRNPAPGYLCELWQITSSGDLQWRTWAPYQSSSASSWITIASGIVNRSNGVTAFTLDPNNPGYGTSSAVNRTIDIVIQADVNPTVTPNATVRLELAVTGRNTSYGFPSTPCS